MDKSNSRLIDFRSGFWAFMLVIIGLSCVQISYIFNGINWLDYGFLFLIPALLLFSVKLLRESIQETKDYCLGLGLLAVAVFLTLNLKYKFQVGTIDDNYHTYKVVAFSIKNSFFSKMQIFPIRDEVRMFFMDFTENIYGIAWRIFRWDFIIVLFQSLPVFVLWRELVDFFRKRNVVGYPGFLSAVIILSMQIIWSQASSTYVDGITGVIAALTLLKLSDLLSFPSSRNFYNISVTAFLSALCLLTKVSSVFLALFAIIICFWISLKSLKPKEILLAFLILVPSLGYCFKHYISIWLLKGSPFYPMLGYKAFETFHLTGKDGICSQCYNASLPDFKPIQIINSWIKDYQLGFVTADPWDVGNGLLWVYFVLPVLIIAFGLSIFNFRKMKLFTPSTLILLFIFLFYFLFDCSVAKRFMIGYNVFIMAWAFVWVITKFKSWRWCFPNWLIAAGILFLFIPSWLSFSQSIKGALYQNKVVSVLQAQKQLFPKYILCNNFQEKYCSLMLDKYKDQSVPDKLGSVLNKCRIQFYKLSPKEKKMRPSEYRFEDVLANYREMRFME
ncbi:MAG: hypothetical protein HQL27_03705 [Candidatus Omnitrophica bacterium]|nr:hypothetical protein [Candidatus Omnitrophota bacterium]